MAETLTGNKILKTRIVLKNDTAENWSHSTGVLLKGEIGIEIDTRKFKIGDGTSDWQALPYANMSIEEIESLFDEKAISIYEKEYNGTTDGLNTVITEVTDPKNGDILIASHVETISGEKKTISQTALIYDGSKNTFVALNGNVNASNVILDSNITMAGNYTAVGNLTKSQNGTATFETKGKSVAEALQQIFTKKLQPTITAQPAVTLTASNNKAYEVGESVTPTYSATLSKGSYTYGPDTGITATSWSVTNNLTGADKETLTTSSGSFKAITVTDSTNYTITATATHGAGAVAKDNVGGNSSPEVKIAAGSKSKTSAAITGYRKPFWGCKTEAQKLTLGSISSEQVRAMSNSGSSVGGVPTTLSVPVGTKQVFFFIKAGTKNSLSATDSNALNAPVAFTKTASAVSVADKSGNNAVAYDMWHCEYDKALTVAQALKLVWA